MMGTDSMTKRETQHAAYHAFLAADKSWSAELRKCFGKNAGDARYTMRGEGEPGSELNRAYLAFKATGDAWRQGM